MCWAVGWENKVNVSVWRLWISSWGKKLYCIIAPPKCLPPLNVSIQNSHRWLSVSVLSNQISLSLRPSAIVQCTFIIGSCVFSSQAPVWRGKSQPCLNIVRVVKADSTLKMSTLPHNRQEGSLTGLCGGHGKSPHSSGIWGCWLCSCCPSPGWCWLHCGETPERQTAWLKSRTGPPWQVEGGHLWSSTSSPTDEHASVLETQFRNTSHYFTIS